MESVYRWKWKSSKKTIKKKEIQADYKKALKSEYTCISSSNSEPAKHKPIVNGRVAGINKNILLDTGAETNVMDFELLKQLKSEKNKLKIFKQKSTLKCANGSSLFAIGYSVVPVTIGTIKKGDNKPLIKGRVCNQHCLLYTSPSPRD